MSACRQEIILDVLKFIDKLSETLGGIDMNFLVTRTPEEVYDRSRRMLERTWESGGYALGSGNSIPEYVPYENYLAMNRAALEFEA